MTLRSARLSLLALPAFCASAPQDARPLSLEAYVAEVLAGNLELQAGACDLRSAEAQVTISRQLPDPQLTAGVASRELRREKRPESPSEHTVGLGWTVELGGKRAARVATARAGLLQAQAGQRGLRAALRASAMEAYAEAARASQVLTRKRRSLEGLRELVRLNALRHQAGDIGGVELAEVRLEAQRYEGEVLAAEAELRAAEAGLRQLLPPGAAPVRAEGLDLPLRSPDPEALRAAALRARPELEEARRAVEAAEGQVRLAKANRVPDLGLSAAVNHTPAVRPSGLDAGGAPYPAPALASTTLSFTVSVPLPFSRRSKAELVQAEAACTEARLRLRALEWGTRTELEATLARYRAAAEQLQRYQGEILGEADRVLEAMAFSYRKGASSLLELIHARQACDEVHLGHAEAQAGHAKALAALERLAGGPLG